MVKVLIVGATSAIAEASARAWAARGAHLFLVARGSDRLETMTADLKVRGAASVDSALADFSVPCDVVALINTARTTLDGIDVALIAHGVLPDQSVCEQHIPSLRAAFEINTLSVLDLLTALANVMQMQGHGSIAVIGSVAGDRGRQSNYVYGASKAALEVFLSGLRNRLAKHGVDVITIKPGFVDTPMTAAFKKGPLWASPESIATGILDAIDKRRDVVYLPWFWRGIMFIIRAIPERLFKRLSL